MALRKPVVNPRTGAVAEYIRIDSINLPSLVGGGTLRFGYYINKEAADDGLEPDMVVERQLTPEQTGFLREQGLRVLYALAKMMPELSGAEDVLEDAPVAPAVAPGA